MSKEKLQLSLTKETAKMKISAFFLLKSLLNCEKPVDYNPEDFDSDEF